MEVLRVTSSFLSLSWNWFHGNRAINLHFLHRNYYFIFLIPHLIDLRSLFIYVVEINLFDVRNIVFEYWNKIRFTSFPSFQDLIFVSEFEYSDINTRIFTYRSFSIQIQKVRILECSDSDSNIRDSSPIISNSKSTQIQIFEYPNSNIRIFEYSDWYSDIQDSDSQVMFITMSIFDIEVVILIVINSTNSDSPRSKFNSRPLYYVRRRVYTVWEASRLQDGPIDDFSRVINSYNEWYWERQRLPASNTRHSIGA